MKSDHQFCSFPYQIDHKTCFSLWLATTWIYLLSNNNAAGWPFCAGWMPPFVKSYWTGQCNKCLGCSPYLALCLPPGDQRRIKMSPVLKLGACSCPQPVADKYLLCSTQGSKPRRKTGNNTDASLLPSGSLYSSTNRKTNKQKTRSMSDVEMINSMNRKLNNRR